MVNLLQKQFEDLGYTVRWSILTASDYGVPQNRKRFFMVGNRLDIDFEFPAKNCEPISVGDAIADLPLLNNGDKIDFLPYKGDASNEYVKSMRGSSNLSTQNYVSKNKEYTIKRFEHIKPGENWRAIPKELMGNYKKLENCHSGIYKRLHPDLPSIVIANYRKNMLIHPFEQRGLSVREAARIQSFPDSFIFKGTIQDKQQQIGNAVPPLLAKAVFEQIIKLTINNR